MSYWNEYSDGELEKKKRRNRFLLGSALGGLVLLGLALAFGNKDKQKEPIKLIPTKTSPVETTTPITLPTSIPLSIPTATPESLAYPSPAFDQSIGAIRTEDIPDGVIPIGGNKTDNVDFTYYGEQGYVGENADRLSFNEMREAGIQYIRYQIHGNVPQYSDSGPYPFEESGWLLGISPSGYEQGAMYVSLGSGADYIVSLDNVEAYLKSLNWTDDMINGIHFTLGNGIKTKTRSSLEPHDGNIFYPEVIH